MLTLNGTAPLIYRLTGRFGPFHVAALIVCRPTPLFWVVVVVATILVFVVGSRFITGRAVATVRPFRAPRWNESDPPASDRA